MLDFIHDDSTSNIDRAVREMIAHHRMTNEKSLKKTTTIGFRSSTDFKESFIKACSGVDYSTVLEELVAKFIEASNSNSDYQPISGSDSIEIFR